MGKPRSKRLAEDASPAVQIYYKLTGLVPNPVQEATINSEVAADELEEWYAALWHWMGHGWSPRNVTGMISSYQAGGESACLLCHRRGAREEARS